MKVILDEALDNPFELDWDDTVLHEWKSMSAPPTQTAKSGNESNNHVFVTYYREEGGSTFEVMHVDKDKKTAYAHFKPEFISYALSYPDDAWLLYLDEYKLTDAELARLEEIASKNSYLETDELDFCKEVLDNKSIKQKNGSWNVECFDGPTITDCVAEHYAAINHLDIDDATEAIYDDNDLYEQMVKVWAKLYFSNK